MKVVCAQSRHSTRLQAAADCGSGKTAWQTCQPPSIWDWRWPSLCRLDRTGSVGVRTGVGRAKTVMRRWGYLDDAQSVDCDCGEPQTMAHLLSWPPTRRGLYGWRPGHSDRAGKGMRPQVGEHYVKDTTEEESSAICAIPQQRYKRNCKYLIVSEVILLNWYSQKSLVMSSLTNDLLG